jgi:WD40 repeat protein
MGDDEELEMPPQSFSHPLDDSGFTSGFASFLEDMSEELPHPILSFPKPAVQSRLSTVQGPSTGLDLDYQGQCRSRSHITPMCNASLTTGVVQSTQHSHPNYKLLHLTCTRLQHRFLSSSYHLSTLQSRGTPGSHTNTIYCLQLYTYPGTGNQVLFTGSKDRTIKEWDLTTGAVLRTIEGIHEGSILSICVHGNYLASAGSDCNVILWDLTQNKIAKIMEDHEDSVLCVRFDDTRLVSCSKGEVFPGMLMLRLIPNLEIVLSELTATRISIHSTSWQDIVPPSMRSLSHRYTLFLPRATAL